MGRCRPPTIGWNPSPTRFHRISEGSDPVTMLEEPESAGPARPTISLFGRPRFTVAGVERSLPGRERALAFLLISLCIPAHKAASAWRSRSCRTRAKRPRARAYGGNCSSFQRLIRSPANIGLKPVFEPSLGRPDSSVDCDLRMFERTSGEDAIALYTGDLLPGVVRRMARASPQASAGTANRAIDRVATRAAKRARSRRRPPVRRALESDPGEKMRFASLAGAGPKR